ncbi:MAG: GTP cyclohydrolase I [Myxococcota bacterium]|nr:GTP cyclohydrolase I [Myxococcota bacterium]
MTPEEHFSEVLRELGFDGDPEMARTARQFVEVLRSFRPDAPLPEVGVLESGVRSELVVVRGLPFWSLCAHHLLPFFGTCTIAYQPGGRIAGLGALPRVLQALARRPQVQERLADQLADHLVEALDPISLGARLEARHMCMEMRGACSPGTLQVLALRGAENPDLSAALLVGAGS